MTEEKNAAVSSPSFPSYIYGLTVTLLFFFGLYSPVFPELFRDWLNDPNYSHGFLIPFISGYLIWERKNTLLSLHAKPFGWGIACVIAGLCLYILGIVAAEQFMQRISMVVVIFGIVAYNLGTQILKIVAFPLGYLVLMVPLPYLIYDQVAFPLKLFAAQCATYTLYLIGVPVFREGNIIELVDMRLEVADACSGIRSLISLLALSIIFAYLSQHRFWKRCILVCSTIPIAIIANAARVSGTGILAQFWGSEVAEGFFHSFSGWLIFIVATIFLFAVGKSLSLFPIKK